jgi:hypothetical protein
MVAVTQQRMARRHHARRRSPTGRTARKTMADRHDMIMATHPAVVTVKQVVTRDA